MKKLNDQNQKTTQWFKTDKWDYSIEVVEVTRSTATCVWTREHYHRDNTYYEVRHNVESGGDNYWSSRESAITFLSARAERKIISCNVAIAQCEKFLTSIK